jgi:ATP-dependent protease HslVU (ClpYQ) peptidase subunit
MTRTIAGKGQVLNKHEAIWANSSGDNYNLRSPGGGEF